MTYYRYSQNNSGGSFGKPAIEVFIKAHSPEEADEIAVKHGIYFDPFYAVDCECCGSRWYEASSRDSCEELPPEDLDEWYDNFIRDGVVKRLVIEG